MVSRTPGPRPSGPTGTSVEPVLCVDLEDSLLADGAGGETFFALLGQSPLEAVRLPWWRGAEALRREVLTRAPERLGGVPLSPHAVERLRAEKERGRRMVLVTRDARLGRRVADQIGLFETVLTAREGREASVREHCGGDRYDWFSPSPSARTTAGFGARVRLLRPHQWAKNLLVFVPIFLAHAVADVSLLASAGVAALCLSLVASATYILNDLSDIASDRAHPSKRFRPLAAGQVSVREALGIAAVTATVGFGVSLFIDRLPLLLLAYTAATLAYSSWLKRKVFIDVLLLTGLYALRILIGGEVTGIPVSEWLLAFSVFFFMSLALAKRYCELARLSEAANPRRGYRREDIQLIAQLGPTCGYIAVLVFMLYVSGTGLPRGLYPRHTFLWLIAPLLLYWISRVWFLAHRGELEDDPIVFAVKDRHTWLIGALCAALVGLASYPIDVGGP